MNKIIFCILTLFIALSTSAQDMSQTMTKYAEGCFLLRDAIESNDFGKLVDAKVKFHGIKLCEISNADFFPIDLDSEQAITYPTIKFTPEFATTLIDNGVITLSEIHEFHSMRKGDDVKDNGELYLWHASIKPHSIVKFKSYGTNECEMFLCSTYNSDMSLSIWTEGTDYFNGIPLKNTSAWYASWNMKNSPEEFRVTIANNGDNQATVVIAINGD